MYRRALLTRLGAATLVGTAGCLGSESRIEIENTTGATLTVAITITRQSDRRVLVRTEQKIDPGETASVTLPVEEPGGYRIQVVGVTVESGGSTTLDLAPERSTVITTRVTPEGVTFERREGG